MATAANTTKKSGKTSGKAPAAAKKAAAKPAAKKPEAKKPAKAAPAKSAPPAAQAKASKAPAPKARTPKPHAPAKAPAAKPEAAKAPAPVPEKVEAAKPVRREKPEFAVNDYVVYPTHGVGRVTAIEERTIAGEKLTLFVISFERERMTLKVPIEKVKDSGLRKLSNRKIIDSALKTLKGRSRVKRTMWSRRAQEYEAKINSGDPVSIAEVVRDLHRNADQPDQSYSERQMYQAALDRLARELAAVESVEHDMAVEKLEKLLKAA